MTIVFNFAVEIVIVIVIFVSRACTIVICGDYYLRYYLLPFAILSGADPVVFPVMMWRSHLHWHLHIIFIFYKPVLGS